MIESAQAKHIRELEAEVNRLGDFNCELDREVENMKEHLATANYNIGELYGAIEATDKLLADIQKRVALLENYTAVPDPNDIRVWPWPRPPSYRLSGDADDPTVDELHDRIAYLEKELAAANAEANRLRKRVADLEGQLQIAQSEFTCSPIKDIKWVSTADEEIESLKAEIHQLSYDRDTLAKRLADICNIAKKET